MKSLLLILSFTSMLSFCSENIKSQITADLEGKWIWAESSGGILGKTTTPATTKRDITIEFTNEKFIQYVNGEIEKELTYTIEKGSSIRTEEDTYLVVYENGRKQSFELKEDRLILYDECHDCFQHEYTKK